MTAALGIIHDYSSNTQKFFGGGVVDQMAKNVSSDADCHTDDILSLNASYDKKLIASGQVGASPVAFVWDAANGRKLGRYKLPKGSRGINAISISQDNKYVACVDLHDSHNVFVFDVQSGQMVYTEAGDTGKIFDLCFSAQPGSHCFVTAGAKHIKFWNVDERKVEKGIFGQKGEQTSFACAAYDD